MKFLVLFFIRRIRKRKAIIRKSLKLPWRAKCTRLQLALWSVLALAILKLNSFSIGSLDFVTPCKSCQASPPNILGKCTISEKSACWANTRAVLLPAQLPSYLEILKLPVSFIVSIRWSFSSAGLRQPVQVLVQWRSSPDKMRSSLVPILGSYDDLVPGLPLIVDVPFIGGFLSS